MTHSASFFSSHEIDADTPTPLSSIGEERRGEREESAVTRVGLHRLSRVEMRDLSDSALEVYIRACVELQHQAQSRFISAHGTFADAAERDQWLIAEHEARDHLTVRAELNRGHE